MPIHRFDPTKSDWEMLAPSGKLRPHHANPKPAPESATITIAANCWLCEGNGALTPGIYSVSETHGGAARWRVWVVPCKFLALCSEESPAHLTNGSSFHSTGGCGAHEIIVEHPDPSRHMSQQPTDQIEAVLRTLQWRYHDSIRYSRFKAMVTFKSHGAEKCSSLPRPHWQLIATPVVPRLLHM